MKSFIKLFVATFLASIFLSACNREKSWTISGTFDIPDTLVYGDTFVVRPPLDGTYVYLISPDGDMLDSALVSDESFSMSGTVLDPEMRYLACEYCVGTVVLEPGEINVIMSDSFEATGTVNNDGIARMEARLAELSAKLHEQGRAIDSESDGATSDSVRQLMYNLYFDFINNVSSIIDSTAEAHPEDMVGVYAWVMKLGPAQDVEQFDQMLAPASDYVKKSEFIVAHRQYLEGIAATPDNFDPSAFGLNLEEDSVNLPAPR